MNQLSISSLSVLLYPITHDQLHLQYGGQRSFWGTNLMHFHISQQGLPNRLTCPSFHDSDLCMMTLLYSSGPGGLHDVLHESPNTASGEQTFFLSSALSFQCSLQQRYRFPCIRFRRQVNTHTALTRLAGRSSQLAASYQGIYTLVLCLIPENGPPISTDRLCFPSLL